jgi:hypothetical protein
METPRLKVDFPGAGSQSDGASFVFSALAASCP